MSKAEYQRYIEAASEHHLKESRRIIDNWKNNITESNLFGYSPTSYPASFGVVLGYLYQYTGDEKYAEKVVELLLEYEDIKRIYPKKFYEKRIEYQNGLPPISDFFDMNAYAKAYDYIRGSKKISPDARATIEKGVADCANFLFTFPEWGAMNRAILRAQAFIYSAIAVPHHPDAPRWRKMAEVLASDSYQRWEGEDAQSYHPVWLLALFQYAEAAGAKDFFNSAIPHYYLDYFAHQTTPMTMFPDYGDAWWPTLNGRWIAIFEKGAAAYQSPTYKWVARKFWEAIKASQSPATDLGLARNLIDAINWGDENLGEQPISGKSRLVMDELVGKKIVMRNGIDPQSTYLMLNYQDEGDGAFMFREFMRTSILAEQEKPHHGHSDENSITLLVNKGSILLHEAGYRNALPSGDYGNYRADFYHNRLVVRKHRRWIRHEGQREEQPMYEFLRHAGSFHSVRTKLIDFFNFKKFDFSRTRLTDDENGYVWDRSVIYHKENDFFIVVDGVKVMRRDTFTFTNLWHSEKILAQGPGWFNTRIDRIAYYGNQNLFYQNAGNRELLIYIPPQNPARITGAFDQPRHDQPEKTIFDTISGYYYENQMEAFVTILFPHDPGADLEKLLQQFEILKSSKYPEAVGLNFNAGDHEDIFTVKLNLEMDYTHHARVPRYDYELGKVQYGPVETDGNVALVSRRGNKLAWACSHMTQLKYGEKVLQKSLLTSQGMQPTPVPGIFWAPAKWRYWEQEDEM